LDFEWGIVWVFRLLLVSELARLEQVRFLMKIVA